MDYRELVNLLQNGDKSKWDVCYRIAESYYEGKDFTQAFSWYNKAAAIQGCNPIAYFQIAYAYQHGEGVETDIAEAVKWYEKAAEGNVPQALYNLAYFYQNGVVVQKDPEKALELLRKATALMHGLVLERDSYEVWKTAAEKELETGRRRVQELDEKNKSLALELERRSNEWKAESARFSAELEVEKNGRETAEKLAAEYRSRMDSSIRASENLIKKILSENNASFEKMQEENALRVKELQEAYSFDIKKMEQAYSVDLGKMQAIYLSNIEQLEDNYGQTTIDLQKRNEDYSAQNAALIQKIDTFREEAAAATKTIQQLQGELATAKKKFRVLVGVAVGVLFLVVIFL